MPYADVIDIPQGWDNPRTVQLASGWRGTRITVSTAHQLVNDALTDPLVVATAQNLVRKLPERDQWAEARAIDNFVKGKIRYTNEGIETLKSPGALLSEIRQYGKAIGDCDDHVILWAALHKALGHPVRFRVISQRPDKLANHIYGEVFIKGRGWVGDELIVKNRPLGWVIPRKEVTKSVAFLAGLGGLSMPQEMVQVPTGYDYYTMVNRGQHRGWRRGRHRGWRHRQRPPGLIPQPASGWIRGGAQQTRPVALEIPSRLQAVREMVAHGYMVKTGGHVVQHQDGSLSAVGEVGKFSLKKITKGISKLVKGVLGGGKKETCPKGYHSDGKGKKGGGLKSALKIAGKIAPALLLGVDDYIQTGDANPCPTGYSLSGVGG